MAWSVGMVSIALMIGALVLMFLDRHATLPSTASAARWTFSDILTNLVNIAVPTIGIVLASRRPENRIGWLFLTAGVALGLTVFGTSYGVHALVADPGSLPAGRSFAWVGGSIGGGIPIGALAFLFLLFPTGHLRSPRWRPAAWFVGGAFTLVTVAGLVFATQAWDHPFSQSTGGGVIGWLFVPSFLAGLAVSLAAVVVRFRGSVGDERLQLKWFVTAAALVVATLFASFFTPSSSSTPAFLSVLQNVAFVFLWTAIAVAVLKYRLYEIDVVISRAVVYGALAVFITLVYVGLVIGVGTLVGNRRSPLLSAIAAAMIAVAFQPVRERSRRFANRLVYRKRATPYEVLSEFAEHMAGTYSLEDVLPRMARILGEGTGARRARVWLRLGDELRPAAGWGEPGGDDRPLPAHDGELPAVAGASKVVPVRHEGDLLGALTVTKPPNEPLTAAEGKLVDDLAAQAGLVLRNVRLTEELRGNLEELRASRQRIVAAQDQARRGLERNIHDGAQQQLVALTVKLRLAGLIAEKDPPKTRAMIDELQGEAVGALENLRDLARGIYPPLLADKGLHAALDSQARRSAVPTTVVADGLARYPQDIEAAVYFCTLEALQNVAKYANASSASVGLAERGEALTFTIRDDGVGFDPSTKGYGTGMQGMADRLAALGGELRVTSAPGEGTLVEGRVPIDRMAALAAP